MPAHNKDYIPCGLKFLKVLIEDLELVLYYRLVERHIKEYGARKSDKRDDCDDMKDIDLVEYLTFEEVQRLHESPDLFASAEIRGEFFNYIHDMCEFEKRIRSIKHPDDLYLAWHQEELDDRTDSLRPTFQAHLKPWQQFLHNGPPGACPDPDRVIENGSMQVIPPGGLNILEHWQRENEQVMKTYDEVSVPLYLLLFLSFDVSVEGPDILLLRMRNRSTCH